MSAHTPGPWHLQRVVTNYRSGATSLQARGTEDELIVTFPGCQRDKGNARLIAAAPELLGALERAAAILGALPDGTLGNQEPAYIAYCAAKDAIAKATGAA